VPPVRRLAALGALAAVSALACAGPRRGSEQREADTAQVDRAADDRAHIETLEREARALATTTGCDRAHACRSAPLGWRACGGPRDFVVYCAATTDTAALFAKLRALELAERAYNQRAGLMSTCEMRLPPVVSLSGGACRAAAP
jgi:hypothetical protein